MPFRALASLSFSTYELIPRKKYGFKLSVLEFSINGIMLLELCIPGFFHGALFF